VYKRQITDELNASISDEKYQAQVLTALTFSFRNMSNDLIDSAFYFDIETAHEKLIPVLTTWYLGHALVSELYATDPRAMNSLSQALEVDMQAELIRIQNAILEMSYNSANLETEVEINADRLKAMPENSITEVSFSSHIQNYQWTTEEALEGEEDTLHLLPL